MTPRSPGKLFGVLLLVLFAASSLRAASAEFDLAGPRLEVKVMRGGKTLPISQVPNLQAGDQIWLHPEVPANQSIHYLLIPVFLRGSLNPPPSNWFTKVETWHPQVRSKGVEVTVPNGALQALIFWAPETGGGFTTVRTAVRARPGVFVRAAQDLYAADLTRSRLDAYVRAVKQIAALDPTGLQKRATLLARTLYLKIDEKCFDLPTEQQESCLTQNPSNVVLNDTQSESMVTALTSGAASDMINQLGSSSAAGGGAYSPYVGAIVDMVRIMGSLHNAQYAYIPALAIMRDDAFDLKLNSPPSFSNPKSVMVASLPPVATPRFPDLRAVHPEEMLCLERPSLVLSVEGAPLVFSTGYAHNMVLRVRSTSGGSIDLPATAHAQSGGFLVDAKALQTVTLDGGVTADLRGDWGFDSYDGPVFRFTSSQPEKWTFASNGSGNPNDPPSPNDLISLTSGQSDTVYLHGDSTACVEKVVVSSPEGKFIKADWKATPPHALDVTLKLPEKSEGVYTLAVAQYGQKKTDNVAVHAYPPSATLGALSIHAGDRNGKLTGSRLDEMKSVEIGGVTFLPGEISKRKASASGTLASATPEKLLLKASANAVIATLQSGASLTAHVQLKDGRVIDLPVTIKPPRPDVVLLSKNVALDSANQNGPVPSVQLGNQGDLPQNGRLTFFLKSVAPPTFPRDEKIEIAAVNGGFDTMLGLSDGGLTLQDAQTVLAVLDPAKAFGPSAFGPLQFRAVNGDGIKGDWQPLTNLVRLPTLKDIRCPASPEKACTLEGNNLFLIDSVSASAKFTRPVSVPLGFAGYSMTVPRPSGTVLYLKLRDDPTAINQVALPVYPDNYGR